MFVKDELEVIRQKNGGFLRPQDVIEFAKNPKTRLHAQFEWDDTKAAEKYRIAQARAIIKVSVTIQPNTNEKTHTYVSLSIDRGTGAGYRHIVEVLNDEVLRDVLLQDALREAWSFKKKYDTLKDSSELGGVMAELGKLPPLDEEAVVAA